MKCAVIECVKSVKGRGWCDKHYARWRRHGDPTAGASPRFKNRVCSAVSCDRSHDSHGYCTLHLRRWRKHGDPQAAALPRPQSGPRVEVTGYRNAHKRIDRWRGSPLVCDYCGITEGRFQWALKAGLTELRFEDGRAYSLDVHDYIRLCMRCHWRQEHFVQVAISPAPAKAQEATA